MQQQLAATLTLRAKRVGWLWGQGIWLAMYGRSSLSWDLGLWGESSSLRILGMEVPTFEEYNFGDAVPNGLGKGNLRKP